MSVRRNLTLRAFDLQRLTPLMNYSLGGEPLFRQVVSCVFSFSVYLAHIIIIRRRANGFSEATE